MNNFMPTRSSLRLLYGAQLNLWPFLFLAFFLLSTPKVYAQQPENEIANKVEQLKIALLKPDSVLLKKITSTSLTYGHSGGLIENQVEFIHSLMTKKFKFQTLSFTNVDIQIEGSTAIVRHLLTGETNDRDKEPGTANLKIMLVFTKSANEWKLIARQAIKNNQIN